MSSYGSNFNTRCEWDQREEDKEKADSLFELQSFMCCRDASLWIPLSPCLLHNCHQTSTQEQKSLISPRSHITTCAHTPRCMYCKCMSERLLTCICRPEMVWVAGKEGLMVLCWQVHIVVCQRLSTCYPRIPEHQHRDTFIIRNRLSVQTQDGVKNYSIAVTGKRGNEV